MAAMPPTARRLKKPSEPAPNKDVESERNAAGSATRPRETGGLDNASSPQGIQNLQDDPNRFAKLLAELSDGVKALPAQIERRVDEKTGFSQQSTLQNAREEAQQTFHSKFAHIKVQFKAFNDQLQTQQLTIHDIMSDLGKSIAKSNALESSTKSIAAESKGDQAANRARMSEMENGFNESRAELQSSLEKMVAISESEIRSDLNKIVAEVKAEQRSFDGQLEINTVRTKAQQDIQEDMKRDLARLKAHLEKVDAQLRAEPAPRSGSEGIEVKLIDKIRHGQMANEANRSSIIKIERENEALRSSLQSAHSEVERLQLKQVANDEDVRKLRAEINLLKTQQNEDEIKISNLQDVSQRLKTQIQDPSIRQKTDEDIKLDLMHMKAGLEACQSLQAGSGSLNSGFMGLQENLEAVESALRDMRADMQHSIDQRTTIKDLLSELQSTQAENKDLKAYGALPQDYRPDLDYILAEKQKLMNQQHQPVRARVVKMAIWQQSDSEDELQQTSANYVEPLNVRNGITAVGKRSHIVKLKVPPSSSLKRQRKLLSQGSTPTQHKRIRHSDEKNAPQWQDNSALQNSVSLNDVITVSQGSRTDLGEDSEDGEERDSVGGGQEFNKNNEGEREEEEVDEESRDEATEVEDDGADNEGREIQAKKKENKERSIGDREEEEEEEAEVEAEEAEEAEGEEEANETSAQHVESREDRMRRKRREKRWRRRQRDDEITVKPRR